MAAPTVTTLTPSTGSAYGGTAVVIVGTGFTAASAVTFGTVDATTYTVYSSTVIAAVSPVHAAGAVAVEVTNADGTSANAVEFTYTAASVLFTVAEARAFDKGQLANTSLYSDATITAKEAAVRAKFERIIGVALSPTVATEYYDGDGGRELSLYCHNPWAESPRRPVTVSSVTEIATDDSERAYTAAELSDLVKYSDRLYRRSGAFLWGHANIKVVYTHGYTAAPDDIKTAALWACCQELIPSSAPSSVIDGTDGTINWSRVKDATRGRWYGNESIDSVLREHQATENLPGVA